MKTRTLLHHVFLRLALAFILVNALSPSLARAQGSESPDIQSTWQTSATGLRTTQNSEGKTAGLGFQVFAQSWPYLMMNGGVQASESSYIGPRLAGYVGIDLGQVKVTGGGGGLVSQSADWAHNQLNFNQMTMWVSRLSAAVAVQSTATSLTFFNGNVDRYSTNGTTISNLGAGAAYPKYAAYRTAAGVQIKTLSSSDTTLPGLLDNWVLLWYGNNSHIVDSKRPMSYEWTLLQNEAYQADVPMLLVFGNPPQSLKQASGGGVQLTFSGQAGNAVILPLFGRDSLRTSVTETWAGGLPQDVQTKLTWWRNRSCKFPITAAETYAYSEALDKTTITESIGYVNLANCAGGVDFAPLPPMLALARTSLSVSFSGAVQDGNLNTEFGPSQGIDGTQSYSWSISGMQTYTEARREVAAGSVPAELTQRLTAEIQKVLASGHYAPWIFLDAVPGHRSRGDLYWANPADVLLHLVEVVEAVGDPALRTSLINYINSERSAYPPETVYNLGITQGKNRGPFSFLGMDISWYWDPTRTLEDTRQEAFLKDVPLYSFYALSRYYDLMATAPTAAVLQAAQTTLDRDMREQDWASFYWFSNYQDRETATVNANRHFAGLLGYVRLMQKGNNVAQEELGRALLAKAAVLRVGMAKYPRYLYASGLTTLPASATWMMNNGANPFRGYLYNYDWADAYDDPRQILFLNQFSVDLNDYNYTRLDSPYLLAFRDMVPELGRYLGDMAKTDVEVVLRKVEALYPHWYAAFAEGTLGWEHNLMHPVDSFQIFTAKAWIMGETGLTLGKYADIPFLSEGDLFYMQKLAEAIKVYRGVSWSTNQYINLGVVSGNGFLDARWTTNMDVTQGQSWLLVVDGPGNPSDVPLPYNARTYRYTGLSNYATYTVSIRLLDDQGQTVLGSNAIQAMPSDRHAYLPIIRR